MNQRPRGTRARWPAAAPVFIYMFLYMAWAGPAHAQTPGLTLDEAVARALARHPELGAAAARVDEARGRLTGAETYPFNPTLSGAAGARTGDRRTLDMRIELAQEIELAGQRRDRTRAARAELAAERARVQRAKHLVAGRVHTAFVDALEARDLLAAARTDADLARRLLDLAQKRLAQGAATQLEVNLAAVELGRAEARRQAADGDYQSARAGLARAMGADPMAPPVPRGDLATALPALPRPSALAHQARTDRSDVAALRALERAGRARHSLARSQAWPNMTVRAFVDREAGTETIIGGGLSIPIPLFERNQGRIAETRAAIKSARARRELAELEAARQIATTYARYRAAATTAERLEQRVIGTLEQNLGLLQRSFDAGHATWPEVLIIRRTFFDAQRELITARAGARRAWIELQVAAGRMPTLDARTATEVPR